MLLISHRGNIAGIFPERENTKSYIDEAIGLGYDVEIDVRKIVDCLYLGHDTPDYEVSLEWLIDRKSSLWIHTKNFAGLSFLIDYDLRVFFHQKEEHTIINNCNIVWSHNIQEANEKSIIPLLDIDSINDFDIKQVYGICSDYIANQKLTKLL